MRYVSQRHRRRPVDHEIVGDRLSVFFHLRAKDALTDEIDGADHKQSHDHGHDGPDGGVGRRRRLLGGNWKHTRRRRRREMTLRWKEEEPTVRRRE